MKKSIGFVFLVVVLCVESSGQAKVRKLSTSINHPSLNLFAPYISADANAMVFLSDDAEDQILTPFYTFREATDWRAPQMLPKSLHTRLNFVRGYSLSADGKRLYISTMKSPGVGGFDIWFTDWKGSSWSEPANPGMPINSKGHEACPSVTADGNTMYFMRCDLMDQEKADNCKIFRVTKKPNGQWDVPVELPANINTGNSQVPRIMADGETLIFSSNKISPSKGGMDLYESRQTSDGKWSDPVPLDFVNTSGDDQYVSVNALGRYLLRDSPGPRKNEIVEYLFPAELRPKGLMKIEGKVADPSGAVVSSYVSAKNGSSKRPVYNGRPDGNGLFMLYLKEGQSYELTVEPEFDQFTYFARRFDLTGGEFPQLEKISVVLKDAQAGDELALDLLSFRPNSAELDLASSSNELKRLARLINGNPDLKFEVQVLQSGYREDSVNIDPDLTEVFYDSVVTHYEVLDSAGMAIQKDTVIAKAVYHNDRTIRQANAVVDLLVSEGVSRDRLSVFGNAIPAVLPEEKKLTVKGVFR